MTSRTSLLAAAVIACAMILVPPAGAADPSAQGELEGVVLDATTRTPVPGALVSLQGLPGTVRSDSTGRFAFDALPPGKHRIKVQRIGYKEAVLETSVADARRAWIEVLLSIYETPEVEVHGAAGGPARILSSVAISGPRLQRQTGSTLSATLAGEPGLAERTMGPAAARPVVRGLGGHRLLLLEDGMETGDLSATSPDHAVVQEMLGTRSIEVRRGPAGLASGAGALGGAIEVKRERIPAQRPDRVEGEIALQTESAAPGVAGHGSLTLPIRSWVARVEGTRRDADDLRTPTGRLANTASRLGAVGVSIGRPWSDGSVGVSWSDHQTDYGIPGGFLGGHPRGVDIELSQQRFEARLWRRPAAGWISEIDLHYAWNRYYHRELETNDICGVSFGLVRQEARASSSWRNLPWGEATTGLSFEHRDFAQGCLSFLPRTHEWSGGGFLLARGLAGDWTLEGAMRYDIRSVRPLHPDTNKAGIVRDRTFRGPSASVRCARPFMLGHRGRLLVEGGVTTALRLPAIEELFSEGPHLAGYSYEVGNADLGAERGWAADAVLGWQATERPLSRDGGGVELTVFRHQVDGFIHASDTGELEYGAGAEGVLARYRYSGRPARLNGAELRAVCPLDAHWACEATVSAVRGSFADTGRPMPQIPPAEGRLALRGAFGLWSGGAAVRGAAAQRRTGEFEEPTAAYALLEAGLEWNRIRERTWQTVVLRIDNLLDATYRNHLSRVKSVQPEAGRGVSLLYRLQFR